jgi:hypothetical protein
MLIVRIFLIVMAIALFSHLVMYALTRNKIYYQRSWLIVRFTVLLGAVFVLLYVLERYVLVAWRVLL